MVIKNYRDLTVWQSAMDLVEEVYRLSSQFPKDELYGLTAQMRRAAVSIPSNIAEGQGRGGDTEFHRFLRIAYGSLRELETQILLSQRLGYTGPEETKAILENAAETGRMLNGLINCLKKS